MAKRNTVGVVGLGRMGNPVAQRFIKAKIPLMAWDILPEARAPFERKKGVRLAPPGEMAASCAVILFVVPSSAEIADCLKGKAGVLANAKRGLVIYDMTTGDPTETRKLARRAARKEIPYLDAGMIGGDEKVFRRTKKHLAPFTEHLFHLGKLGSGHAMKLIHNMVLHTMFLATCEGARLCERMGMRVADMIDVFNVSTAFSYHTRHRFPNNILNGSWNAQARIYNPWKDLGIAVRLAREAGAPAAFGEQTYAFLEKAVKRGMIEEDYSLLYRDFEAIGKVGGKSGSN